MKSIAVLSIFLVLSVFIIGMILPIDDNAEDNAEVQNSVAITISDDGWALPIGEGNPCHPHQICI